MTLVRRPHIGEIGQHTGDIRGHRRRRRPVDHAGAGAAAPLDEPFTRQFAKRAPHGDAGHAVTAGKLVLGREFGAEADGAAANTVTQNEIDLLRLRFAEPIAQGCHLSLTSVAPGGTLYLVSFSIQYCRPSTSPQRLMQTQLNERVRDPD